MIDFAQSRIERAELTRRLTDALNRGSVILLADAGFGKTTALDDALETIGWPAVWLRASALERDPGRMVARLVDGIRATLPGVGDEQSERLARAIDPLDPHAIAQDLVEELDRLLVEPLVVVVDDAERLDGAPSL